MLTIDVKNLTKVTSANGLSETEMASKNKLIHAYLQKIEARGVGFYKTIDAPWTEEILALAKKSDRKYYDVVVLGIGGSSLGMLCLQQSLKHLFENEKPRSSTPRVHVLDNIDPVLMTEIQDVISLNKTLFITISKSGTTPETISQYFYFRSLTDKAELPANLHHLFITDAHKGVLKDIADRDGIKTFPIPDDVGGRFSVQTPVGLVPAALIGIDIVELLKGMRAMRDRFLSDDASINVPFQLASLQYQLEQKGKLINVLMPYSQKLIRLADWYRQLLAESIGKKLNDKGETVNVGITPINALGVTDQHSQTQLYNEGPNDKLFIFVEVEKLGAEVKIPHLLPDNEALGYLQNITFNKLINTEKKATEAAYTQNDRPSITLQIDEVNAYSLGELFMLFEGATAFLGEFYGINAFDQPGVELSKILTREMLLVK